MTPSSASSADIPSKSLVLVVGAGASKEVGLPVGKELKAQIADALNITYEHGIRMVSGSPEINHAYKLLEGTLQDRTNGINPFIYSGWRVRDAMPQAISIDNFIDSHAEEALIETVGKLSIAQCILKAERASKLFIDRSDSYNKLDFKNLEGTWYNGFFQLLTENCRRSGLRERLSKVAVVSFNYDRCVEHYLHCALQNYYGLESREAAEILREMEIYHPYGKVGGLSWQNGTPVVEFGDASASQTLVRLTSELRTFTEGTDPAASEIERIRLIANTADRIVFLGFAYHRLNLQLLFPGLTAGSPTPKTRVFGTAHGISAPDIDMIKDDFGRFAGISPARVRLNDRLYCSGLFSEYWRSLSVSA